MYLGAPESRADSLQSLRSFAGSLVKRFTGARENEIRPKSGVEDPPFLVQNSVGPIPSVPSGQ
jgi:hypothetical protein